MTTLTIHTDGGSRGNPGHAGIGFVVYENNQIIHTHGEYIGVKTNNEAEYEAVLKALDWVVVNYKDNPIQIMFKLDSNLVVNQLNGMFKIKQAHLQSLASQIHLKIKGIKALCGFSHVYRESNTQADAMVNQALDKQLLKTA